MVEKKKKSPKGKLTKKPMKFLYQPAILQNFLAFFDQGGCFQSRGFLILEIKTFGLESTIGDVLSEIHINIVQVWPLVMCRNNEKKRLLNKHFFSE